MQELLIFFIFFISIVLVAISYGSGSNSSNGKIFKSNGHTYSINKIYEPDENSKLYTEKHENEKIYTGNYICDNLTLLPIDQEVFLLKKIQ